MLRVTLDTSVYVGALNSRGFSAQIFLLVARGALRIDISDAIIHETIGVLRDKFEWDGYRLNDAIHRLAALTNICFDYASTLGFRLSVCRTSCDWHRRSLDPITIRHSERHFAEIADVFAGVGGEQQEIGAPACLDRAFLIEPA